MHEVGPLEEALLSILVETIVRHPAIGVYLLIGLVFAVVHILQQNMTSSVNALKRKSAIGFAFMLGTMWPVLGFAMLVNKLQPPPGKREKSETDD